MRLSIMKTNIYNDIYRNEGIKEINSLKTKIVNMEIGSEDWIKTNKRINLLETQLKYYDAAMGY